MQHGFDHTRGAVTEEGYYHLGYLLAYQVGSGGGKYGITGGVRGQTHDHDGHG